MSDATTMNDAPEANAPVKTTKEDDVGTALRNGLRLGGSLLSTWSIAIVMRFLMPRFLGPESFGVLSFSDSFAASYFILLGLGIDTYIQKEIPVRPDHASDFLGGVLSLRVVLSAVLIFALLGTLVATHRGTEVRELVVLFGLGQLFVSLNSTLAALMQARTRVGRLAIVNVVTKLLWAGSTVALLIVRAPLWTIALPLLVTEAFKTALVWFLVRATFDVKMRVDLRAVGRVLLASVPFYLNAMVITLNSKLDVMLLDFLTHDSVQVGWYSAAANLAGLALMLSPLLIWVVLPLLSRAGARSREELWEILRRATEGIVVVGSPVILMAVLGGDVWIRIVFGTAYAPAAMALRALAPSLVLTYLAMLLSMTLIVLERAWTLTIVSSIGLITNVTLTLLLVPACARWIGPGGAGVGDALGVVGMELVVTALLMWQLGRKVLNFDLAIVVFKLAIAAGASCGAHVLLRSLGPARLAIDLVVYLAIAIALGVPKIADARSLVAMVRKRRARQNV
jgi:O-antigen/teichoic acid export membrane protein